VGHGMDHVPPTHIRPGRGNGRELRRIFWCFGPGSGRAKRCSG